MLLPPKINGVLPAFTGSTFYIPFEHNATVNQKNIVGYSVRVTTLISGRLIGTYDGEIKGNTIKVDIVGTNLNDKGELFSVQVAYIEIKPDKTTEIGYYSNTATIRRILHDSPKISLSSTGQHLTGNFYFLDGNNVASTSEVPITYIFNVYNQDGTLFETSGEQIHDPNSVENNIFTDNYILKKELNSANNYTAEYIITTINGYKPEPARISISATPEIETATRIGLTVENNFDNGYIQLFLNTEETAITGTYVISRASEEDNFTSWIQLFTFKLDSEIPKDGKLWKDFTVKQGVKYQYSLQQKNNYNVYSKRKISSVIIADFEDMFLYDGKQQLKIRFNPKVSSFKRTLLESKSDTIGSKYPFMFRNGNVDYKEFAISGLISYQMDEANLFNSHNYFNEQEWVRASIQTGKSSAVKKYNASFDAQTMSDFSSYNIQAEREFKMEVLDWLTNGEPKLFRSPTEGNYLVRLMNTSLSPMDQLGRMLHTFSSTAYEIGEPTFTRLQEYNMLPSTSTSSGDQLEENIVETEKIMKFKSYDLSEADNLDDDENLNLNNNNAIIKYIKLVDAWPTTIININNNDESYIVGGSGQYEAYFEDKEIQDIGFSISSDKQLMGIITIGYYEIADPIYENITNVSRNIVKLRQWKDDTNEYIFEDNNNIVNPIEYTKIYRLHASVEAEPTDNSEHKIVIQYLNKTVSIDLTQTRDYTITNLQNIISLWRSAKVWVELTYETAEKNFLKEATE